MGEMLDRLLLAESRRWRAVPGRYAAMWPARKSLPARSMPRTSQIGREA
jgi:hypothetical protein